MNASQFFAYKQLQIAYSTIGLGKPLILLHGWGVSSRVMEPLASQLSNIRCCYLIDLPGFGESPVPEWAWSVSDYADCIADFIAAHCEGPVDILAHSFGGRITLKLCADSPISSQIDKVLITGGAGMKPRRTIRYYLKKYSAKFMKTPFLLLPQRYRQPALGWLRKTAAWRALGSSDYQQLDGIMREIFVKTVTEYLEGCLDDIPQETLLLWGKTDEATPLYQAERMEKGIRNAALVTIDEAGHYAFLDRPQKFTSIARAFLKAKSSDN